MAENSNIEWCDHTFNPWIGCTKVSPGCAHCYAEAQMDKRLGKVHWGKGQPRQRTSAANWKLPLKWNTAVQLALAEWESRYRTSGYQEPKPRRPRVFCASLADILDPEVPAKWLADLLDLIHCTPNLDWLLLTKRPDLWRARMHAVECLGDGNFDAALLANKWIDATDFVPANVWIGTTVEDQQQADERIPALLNIPARVRFLSCEPLLGPVDLENVVDRSGVGEHWFSPLSLGDCTPDDDEWNGALVNWVICGGESGPNARPMHPDWARSLRDQCAEAAVPFLFKQWGEWAPWHTVKLAEGMERCADDTDKRKHVSHQGDTHGNPHLPGDFTMYRIGKHRAGRHLDGVEHNAFPEVSHG